MLNIDMQKQSKLRSQKAKINCQHILHAANAKAALVAHIIDSVWPKSAPSLHLHLHLQLHPRLQLHSIPRQTRFHFESGTGPFAV